MKKPLAYILAIFILGFLGYWGLEMNHFAKGVKQDAQRLEKFKQAINDTLTNNLIFEDHWEEKIKPIKENYEQINRVSAWTKVEQRNLNQSTEGGIASYYFLGDSLLKVVAKHFGETGKKIQEFYTLNGQLSFAIEQEYIYNRPITWDSAAMKENNDSQTFDIELSEIIEDRSYFLNGELLRQINNQDSDSLFAKTYLLKEQMRLNTAFKELKDHLDQ